MTITGTKPSNGIDTRDVLANLAGNALPLLVGLACVPLLLDKFGQNRFGYISLFWALIGSFSLFDVGLSRALTHFIATRGQDSIKAHSPELFAIQVTILVLGMLGGGLLLVLSPIYVDAVSHIPGLRAELGVALAWVAAAIPITTVAAAFRGILEGLKRFAFVTYVKVPSGILGVAGLLYSDVFGDGLAGAAIVLLLVRLGTMIGYGLPVALAMAVPNRRPNPAIIITTFRFGGWTAVSSVIGPLLVHFDKVLLGALLAPAALTLYTTSFELASRLLLVAGAIATVVYPAAASLNLRSLAPMRAKAHTLMFIFMVPPVLCAVFFSDAIFNSWLQAALPKDAATIFVVMCIGITFNAFAHIPFSIIQGRGSPRYAAAIHAAEVIPYLALLCAAAHYFGALGAAIVWSSRLFIDLILMLFVERTLLAREVQHARHI